MVKITHKYPALLLAVLFLCPALVSADDSDRLFSRAYKLLQAGDYDSATADFGRLRNRYPDHPDSDSHLFFLAKATYYNGRLDSSLELFDKIERIDDGSSMLPYSRFFAGNIHYRSGRIEKALESYLQSYRASEDDRLDELLIESLAAAASAVGPAVVTRLNPDDLPEAKRCPLAAALAEPLINSGEHRRAVSILESCPDAKTQGLLETARQNLKNRIEIGVVLPMSGELQRYGEQIYDGCMMKAEEFRSATGIEIIPVAYDTRGSMLEAGRIIRHLVSGSEIAAVGPLTSDETAVASAALACSDMPLIVPAATQGGLTELSESCFQLQPNLDWQGVKMAEFAAVKLGADSAAIITPTTDENLKMAAAFAQRFESLGGTILGVEYFRANETDFGAYIGDLKSLVIDDLNDSTVFLNADGDTIEAEEVPVRIDCIYIPAEASQLQMILPQFHFYNFNAVYLGGDGWGRADVYSMRDRILKENYFTSGNVDDLTGPHAQAFASKFDRRHGRQPGRLEALGYDALALICEALSAGAYTRRNITEYLSNIGEFRGVSGLIRFGDNHENIELPVYTIKNGHPERIDEIADHPD